MGFPRYRTTIKNIICMILAILNFLRLILLPSTYLFLINVLCIFQVFILKLLAVIFHKFLLNQDIYSYVFTDFLLIVLLVPERIVTKSPTIIVGFSISLFISVNFCFKYFDSLLLDL